MTPPADRSGSRRASSQFTVVCHPKLKEAAETKVPAGSNLSEVVRDLLADWAGYDGPKVVGRSDRVND